MTTSPRLAVHDRPTGLLDVAASQHSPCDFIGDFRGVVHTLGDSTRKRGDLRVAQSGLLGVAHGLGIDLATLWRWQAERESSHVVSIDRANNAEGGSDTGRLPEEPSKLR